MATTYHDGRCPAGGNRTPFVTCGQDRVTGLSPGQAAARRNTNWTTPEHKKGGTFTAGTGTFARTIKSTPPVWRDRTPGRKSPGQKVKRKTNTVCRAKIFKPAVREELAALDMDRVRRNALKRIACEHAGCVAAGPAGDWKHYGERRRMFLEKHPTMLRELDRAQAENVDRIDPAGRRPAKAAQDQRESDRRSVAANVRIRVQALNDARGNRMVQFARGGNPDVVERRPEPRQCFAAVTYKPAAA